MIETYTGPVSGCGDPHLLRREIARVEKKPTTEWATNYLKRLGVALTEASTIDLGGPHNREIEL